MPVWVTRVIKVTGQAQGRQVTAKGKQMAVYAHADHAILDTQLTDNGFKVVRSGSFSTLWKSPCGNSVMVDAPEGETYESVDVYFDYPVSTQMLQALRFPL